MPVLRQVMWYQAEYRGREWCIGCGKGLLTVRMDVCTLAPFLNHGHGQNVPLMLLPNEPSN